MEMGSAMAASLMPSTGLVSEPVRTPLYSKWKVLEEPLAMGVGRLMRTVELVVRRSEFRVCLALSVSAVMLRPLLSSKVTVVRSSSAVKVTCAVAVSLAAAGSMLAVMT
jgi:hypothetical protein